MLHKKGKNFSEISRDLHMSECPVSRQSISKFIKWSSGDLKMLLPFKGQTYNPKRVLTMEHANNALLADTVNNVPCTHDLTDEDLPFPSTPVAKDARYSEGTPVSANNLPLLSTPRTTNDSHHAPINLDDPMLISASLSDSLLFPTSASFNLDSLLSKQNLGDPRIDEILCLCFVFHRVIHHVKNLHHAI